MKNHVRIIQNSLVMFVVCQVVLLTRVQGQQLATTPDHSFSVERARVLPFDTATRDVGPFHPIAAGPDKLRWRQTIVAPATVSALSIHVKIASPAIAGHWELRFLSSNTVRDVIAADSPRGRATEAWSDQIAGNVVIVELLADIQPQGLDIVIDRYDYPVKPSVPQGLFANAMKSIVASAAGIRKLGMPLARLRIKTSQGEAMCTGFLLSGSLLLTNFHCISTNTEAVNSRADFGFDQPGVPLNTFRIEKLEVVNSDLAFDYVVVRVSNNPGNTYGYVTVPSTERINFDGISQNLLMIEHPGGGPKMVSVVGCTVVSNSVKGVDPATSSDFDHHCDTLGGSSGSPVFNRETSELVGLHHVGYPVGSKPSDSLVNQAVFLGYILHDIQAQSPAVFAEISGARH